MIDSLKQKPLAQKILKLAACKIRILENYLSSVALLAVRLYVGMEFWRSGIDKSQEGWQHAKDTFDTLFKPEFEKNHIKHWLGMDIPFPVPPTAFGAFGTSYLEIALAVALMLGFAGRAAAFGIFVIALTIELFVYPGEAENTYWMLLMAPLVTFGMGKISLDYPIRLKLLGADLSGTTGAKTTG